MLSALLTFAALGHMRDALPGTRYILRAAVLVLVTAAISHVPGLAQPAQNPCRNDLLNAAHNAEPPAYAMRGSGTYCDGNVPIPFSGQVVLTSLTLGQVRYPASGSRLLIRVPALQGTEVVRLRGMDQRADRSYRLDGLIPATGLAVDLAAAIHPIGVSSDHLGLFASREGPFGTEYLPVLTGTEPDGGDVMMNVRVPIPAIRLVRQICEGGGATCAAQELVKAPVAAGETVSMAIPRRDATTRIEVRLSVVGAMQTTFGNAFVVVLPGRP